MITLLSGFFLIAWGCRSLMQAVPTFWPDGGSPLPVEWLPTRVNLVVIDENFSPAFLAAAVLLLGLSFWWWRFLNRERWAELLIDMETELRKVSWPTPSDAWQSTLVVTGFTATVVLTILVYDMVIKGFIELFVKA
jgi:preprotein translocase SecE subunit